MHKETIALVKKFVGKISLSFVLLIVLFGACLVGLYAVADMVFEDKSPVFDSMVFSRIAPYYNARNNTIMQAITFFGSHNFLLPANILLILVTFFVKKTKWDAVKIAAISISSTGVMFLLKLLLQRERPAVPLIVKAHGYSFPSGHTFTSVCFFGMLIYIVYQKIEKPWLKWLLIIMMAILVLLIGFSRIYLKLHYTSDVIAGLCLGIIWLLLAKWLLFKTQQKTDKQVPKPV